MPAGGPAVVGSVARLQRRRTEFSDPQVSLFVGDCERAAAFYAALGFRETFRAPQEDPIKVAGPRPGSARQLDDGNDRYRE